MSGRKSKGSCKAEAVAVAVAVAVATQCDQSGEHRHAMHKAREREYHRDEHEEARNLERSRFMAALYVSSFLSAWGDRMWEFAVPILLTEIFADSLFPAATFALATQLSCALFGSVVGKWVDETSRQRVITIALVMQNSCVIICAVIFYHLHALGHALALRGHPHPSIPLLLTEGLATPTDNPSHNQDAISGSVLWQDSTLFSLFVALNVFGSMSSLASMAASVAVGRDWVVVISGSDRALLTRANAATTRISLFCKLAAPVVFGSLLISASTTGGLVFVSVWNAISIFPELAILIYLHNNVPGLAKKPKLAHPHPVDPGWSLRILWQGWIEYFRSERVFLASFGYVCLYLTALCPGALISAYLLIHGLDELSIGLFQAAAAVFGIIPTFFSGHCFRRFGIERTGLLSIWWQDLCLVCAVFWFFYPNLLFIAGHTELFSSSLGSLLRALLGQELRVEGDWNVWLFLGFLMISRIGLWLFDLAERQIMQEYVPEEQRGVVNSVEYSLTNIFSLMSYAMGIVAPKPEQFGLLVIVSVSLVTLAATCYSAWYQRHAFSIVSVKKTS